MKKTLRIGRTGWMLAVLALGCAGTALAQNKECEDNFLFANQLLENNPPDFTDAIKTYQQVLQQCPTFEKADLVDQNLAYAYLHLNPPQVDRAVSVLEDAVQKYPNSTHIADLQTALGTAYITLADKLNGSNSEQAKPLYSKAIGVLQGAVAKVTDPGVKNTLTFNIANAQFNTGEYGAAARTYQALLASTPAANLSPPAYFNLGNAETNLAASQQDPTARENAYAQAATAFQQLLQKFPNDVNAADARMELGKVQFQRKQYEDAAAQFHALENSSDKTVRAQALNGEANSYFAAKLYDKALPSLQQSVQENPGSAEASRNSLEIGFIQLNQHKDLPAALTAYQQAAASKEEKTAQSGQEGEIRIAVNYLESGQNDRALPIYRSLVNSANPKVREDALYGQAMAMVNLKDPQRKQTLADFLRSYPNSPGTANAAYQLAVLEYGDKDYANAMTHFDLAARTAQAAGADASADQVKETRDLKVDSSYWAGESASQAGQQDAALRDWQSGLQADPNFESASTGDTLLGLGKLYTDRNDEQQASRYFNLALTKYPTNASIPDALLALAEQSAKGKQFPKSVQYYQQVVQAKPKDDATGGTAQFNLGVVYMQMTPPQTAQAAQAFQSYLNSFPDGKLAPRAAVSLGQAYESQAAADSGNRDALLDKAVSAYRQAANLSKDSDEAARAAWRIGALEGQLKRTSQATQDLDSAIAKYPNSRVVDKMVFETGLILMQTAREHGFKTAGENQAALAAFHDYLAKYPNGADMAAAHFNAGVLEYNTAASEMETANKANDTAATAQAKADYGKAAADFESSVAGNGMGVPVADAYFYQGWAYSNSDQPTRAVAAFKQMLKSNASGANALAAQQQLGILEATSSPDEAIQYLNTYLASNPKDPTDANLALGEAYEEKGQPAQAIPMLKKVIDATNAEPAAAATFYLAKSYQKQGDNDNARLTYKKVVLLYSGAPQWVDRAKAQLQQMGAQ